MLASTKIGTMQNVYIDVQMKNEKINYLLDEP